MSLCLHFSLALLVQHEPFNCSVLTALDLSASSGSELSPVPGSGAVASPFREDSPALTREQSRNLLTACGDEQSVVILLEESSFPTFCIKSPNYCSSRALRESPTTVPFSSKINTQLHGIIPSLLERCKKLSAFCWNDTHLLSSLLDQFCPVQHD